MSIQQRYNGVFEDITISDKKREEIEAAMRNAEPRNTKFRLKKSVILVCMIMVVMSMGILAIASYKEDTPKDKTKVETKVVGVDTKGKIYVDGVESDLKVEIKEDGFIYSYEEPAVSGECTATVTEKRYFRDEEGNVCILILSGCNPLTVVSWGLYEPNEDIWARWEGLNIPVKAELLTEVQYKEANGIRKVELDKIEPQTIPFRYENKEYTFVFNDTRGIIYKGIVEYDPTGKYSGCEVYDFYQEFFESLDYEPQLW